MDLFALAFEPADPELYASGAVRCGDFDQYSIERPAFFVGAVSTTSTMPARPGRIANRPIMMSWAKAPAGWIKLLRLPSGFPVHHREREEKVLRGSSNLGSCFTQNY